MNGVAYKDLTIQTDVVSNDYVANEDISDTTQDASGSVKKSTWGSLLTSLGVTLNTAIQTLTNKTLTSPKINEDVVVTATSTEINKLDNMTSSTEELNILTGVTATAPEINSVTNGWISISDTWTYASATSFTVAGDKTGEYQKGDKIKLTQTTTKFFYIVDVSYSSPNTTITVVGGSAYAIANALIENPYMSRIESPFGFPRLFSYTPTATSLTGTFTNVSATGSFRIEGGVINVSATVEVITNGTAAGATLVTLPVRFNGTTVPLYGREYATSGAMLQGQIDSARPQQAFVRNSANTYQGGDGAKLAIQVSYYYL